MKWTWDKGRKKGMAAGQLANKECESAGLTGGFLKNRQSRIGSGRNDSTAL